MHLLLIIFYIICFNKIFQSNNQVIYNSIFIRYTEKIKFIVHKFIIIVIILSKLRYVFDFHVTNFVTSDNRTRSDKSINKLLSMGSLVDNHHRKAHCEFNAKHFYPKQISKIVLNMIPSSKQRIDKQNLCY